MADYYVNSVTGSDVNDGSAGSPWATLSHARANVAGTATIEVADGSYTFSESAKPAGAGVHTFVAAAGAQPTLDTLTVAYAAKAAADLIFDGFEVYSTTAAELCRVLDVTNVTLQNVYIHADRWSRSSTVGVTGIRIDNADAVTVSGCYFEEIMRGIIVTDSDSNTYSGNTILVKGGSAIQWAGGNSNGLIENNEIKGEAYTPFPTDPLAFDDPHQSAISIRSNGLTVRGNVFLDIGSSSGVMLYEPDAAGGETAYQNILLEDNFWFNINNNYAIRIYNLGDNIVLRNNKVFSRYRGGPCSGFTNDARYRYETAVLVHNVAAGFDASGLEMYYNKFVGIVNAPAGFLESNNQFWSLTSGGVWQSDTSASGGPGTPGAVPATPAYSGTSVVITSSYAGCGNHNTIFETEGFFDNPPVVPSNPPNPPPDPPGNGMNYVEITVQASAITENHTGWVLEIDLADVPSAGWFWTTVQNGGGDIRCYEDDGVTELARWVKSCDTATETGTLYIKYGGVISSTVNTVVRITADGTSSDYADGDTYGRNAVFADSWLRLEVDGGSIVDVSGNQTVSTTGTPTVNANGTFDVDALNHPTIASLAGIVPDSSYTSFAFLDLAATADPWEGIYFSATANRELQLYRYSSSNTRWDSKHGSGTGTTTTSLNVTTNLFASGLSMIDHTYDSATGDMAFYINGTSEATGNNTRNWTLNAGDTMNFLTLEANVHYVDIEYALRSAAWIADKYTSANDPSALYTVSEVSGAAITLSGAAATNVSYITATVSCNTDTLAGTLYAYISTNPTPPSTTDLKAGTGAAWSGNDATPTATTTFNASGLSKSTTYYAHFYQENGADVSNVLSTSFWATLADPALSNPTETNIAQTTATLSCNTDTESGTIYVVVTTSATPPSAAQVAAGQDHTGSAAVFSASDATPTATTSFSATGLTASTTYYSYFYQDDGDGESVVLGSGAWSTIASAITLSNAAQSGIGETTATVSVDTNTLAGTVYAYVSNSATPPSAAVIKSGAGAIWSGSDATPTATTSFAVTGLTPLTDYYTHFYQEDGASQSNIITSAQWSTPLLSGIYPDNVLGVTFSEVRFRTAGDSNVRFTGDVQIANKSTITVKVNAIEATLEWDGTKYAGPATEIATYLSGQVGNGIPIIVEY